MVKRNYYWYVWRDWDFYALPELPRWNYFRFTHLLVFAISWISLLIALWLTLAAQYEPYVWLRGHHQNSSTADFVPWLLVVMTNGEFHTVYNTTELPDSYKANIARQVFAPIVGVPDFLASWAHHHRWNLEKWDPAAKFFFPCFQYVQSVKKYQDYYIYLFVTMVVLFFCLTPVLFYGIIGGKKKKNGFPWLMRYFIWYAKWREVPGRTAWTSQPIALWIVEIVVLAAIPAHIAWMVSLTIDQVASYTVRENCRYLQYPHRPFVWDSLAPPTITPGFNASDSPLPPLGLEDKMGALRLSLGSAPTILRWSALFFYPALLGFAGAYFRALVFASWEYKTFVANPSHPALESDDTDDAAKRQNRDDHQPSDLQVMIEQEQLSESLLSSSNSVDDHRQIDITCGICQQLKVGPRGSLPTQQCSLCSTSDHKQRFDGTSSDTAMNDQQQNPILNSNSEEDDGPIKSSSGSGKPDSNNTTTISGDVNSSITSSRFHPQCLRAWWLDQEQTVCPRCREGWKGIPVVSNSSSITSSAPLVAIIGSKTCGETLVTPDSSSRTSSDCLSSSYKNPLLEASTPDASIISTLTSSSSCHSLATSLGENSNNNSSEVPERLKVNVTNTSSNPLLLASSFTSGLSQESTALATLRLLEEEEEQL